MEIEDTNTAVAAAMLRSEIIKSAERIQTKMNGASMTVDLGPIVDELVAGLPEINPLGAIDPTLNPAEMRMVAAYYESQQIGDAVLYSDVSAASYHRLRRNSKVPGHVWCGAEVSREGTEVYVKAPTPVD